MNRDIVIKNRLIKCFFFMLICFTVVCCSTTAANGATFNIKGENIGYEKTLVGSQSGVTYTGGINKLSAEGLVVFCLQSGFGIPGFDSQGGSVDLDYAVKAASENSIQNKIAYLGWYSSAKKTNKEYAFTQMYLWQSLPDFPVSGNKTVKFTSQEIRSQYSQWKEQLDDKISAWDKRPSFSVNRSTASIGIKAGTKVEFQDLNNVLPQYDGFNITKNGITITHTKGENSITVDVEESVLTDKVAITEKEIADCGGIKYQSTSTANYTYHSSKAQTLGLFGFVDPVAMDIAFDVEGISNRVKIVKSDKAGGKKLENAQFEIHDADGKLIYKGNTDKDGIIQIEGVPYGKYICKEVEAPEGYYLSKNEYRFEVVKDGEVIEIQVSNEKIPQIEKSPATGDYNDLNLYGIGAVFSLGTVAAAFKRKRKN